MNRIRYTIAAMVGFLVTAPMATVYTAGPPTVSNFSIADVTNGGVLTEVDGSHGVPGDVVRVGYVQRNFNEGVPGAATDPFAWCAWKNGGNEITLGWATVNQFGDFALPNLSTQVYPTNPTDVCASGLMTQIITHSNFGPSTVPVLHWLNIGKPANGIRTVAGSIQYATQVAAMVADGPKDVDGGENHADLSTDGIGAGRQVSWKGNGGTFQSPTCNVVDETNIGSPTQEFPFIVGKLVGHAPGGSVLAIAKGTRPALRNPQTIYVKVNIKGLPGCGGGGFGSGAGLLGSIFKFL
jgi:hypothetical protein